MTSLWSSLEAWYSPEVSVTRVSDAWSAKVARKRHVFGSRCAGFGQRLGRLDSLQWHAQTPIWEVLRASRYFQSRRLQRLSVDGADWVGGTSSDGGIQARCSTRTQPIWKIRMSLEHRQNRKVKFDYVEKHGGIDVRGVGGAWRGEVHVFRGKRV